MIHTKPRYRIDEAFKLLGLARSEGYKRVKEGKLRAQKDGRRSYITADEIDRYVRDGGAPPVSRDRAGPVSPRRAAPHHVLAD